MQLLMLKPRDQRQLRTDEIVSELTAKTAAISGVRVNIFTPQPALAQVAREDGDNLGLVLMTSGDYLKLHQATTQMADAIRKLPMFGYVDYSLKWDTQQFQVNIDREKAADLHVAIPSITNTLSTLIAGRIVGKINDEYLAANEHESLANPDIFSSSMSK